MALKHLLSFLLFLSILACQAQKEYYNWVFGNFASITFNTAPPTAFAGSKLTSIEACASISDKDGNLVLYTDGITVYDSSHSIIQNGSGLIGNTSTAQGAFIYSIDSLNYLIFHAESRYVGTPDHKMYYSKVAYDTSLSGFRVTQKNILYQMYSTERFSAWKNSKTNVLWVIVPRADNDFIYSYLYENDTLIPKKLLKKGFSSEVYNPDFGTSKISPSGKYYASVGKNEFALYEFNPQNGQLSKEIIVRKDKKVFTESFYGIAFSPREKFIYLSHRGNVKTSTLYQCQLDSILSGAIFDSSCVEIVSTNQAPNSFGTLQLGPDGKLYIAKTPSRGYLHAIHHPDRNGILCGYDSLAVPLIGVGNAGLPVILENNIILKHLEAASACVGDAAKFKLTTNLYYDSVIMHYGDGISQTFQQVDSFEYTYINSGDYRPIALLYFNGIPDTILAEVSIRDYPIMPNYQDSILCLGKAFVAPNPDADFFQWQSKNPNENIVITSSNNYVVFASKNGCSLVDSFKIEFLPCHIKTQSICEGDTAYFRLGYGFDTVVWDFGDGYRLNTTDSQVAYIYTKSGAFSVRAEIKKKDVVLAADTVLLVKPKPQLIVATDTVICVGAEIQINVNPSESILEFFDSSSKPVDKINQAGIYVIEADLNSCYVFDTIKIETQICDCQAYIPNAFTPDANGLNENFTVVSSCELKDFDMQIYNRWGQLIFQSNNPISGWDATHKGNPVPDGVYVWLMKYTANTDNKRHYRSGSVHVLR